MPPLNLKWKIFGRPVKPVSFALTLTMLVIANAGFTDTGVLGDHFLSDFLGGGAVAIALLFVIAWVHTSQRLAETAMLLSCFLWTTRFWLIIFVAGNPIRSEGLWLSACWAIVAAGSYLLERIDSNAIARSRRHYSKSGGD